EISSYPWAYPSKNLPLISDLSIQHPSEMTDERANENKTHDVESLNTDDLPFLAEKRVRQVVGRVISTNLTYLMAGLNGAYFQFTIILKGKLISYYRRCYWCVDPLYATGLRCRSLSNLLCLPYKFRWVALCFLYQYPYMLEVGNGRNPRCGSFRPVFGICTHVLETSISTIHGSLLPNRHGSRVSGCAVQHVYHHS